MLRQPILVIAIVTGFIGLSLFLITDVGADTGGAMDRSRYGILGQPAPALNLSTWIDATGKAVANIELSDYSGKVVYLYFFQHWCPGCHAHGFPTLQTIAETFKGDDGVALLAVQTAFEGKSINTADKLRKNQIDYDLPIPMAHDGGGDNPRGLPQTMIVYRSGGTPWTVIIDPKGKVVYNQFHIDVHQAIDLIRMLRKDG